MLVAMTSSDPRHWVLVAMPGPVAVAVAVVLLRQNVPAGPDWSIPALLLAPFWLLLAASMLSASLRREWRPGTFTSACVYLGHSALLLILVRLGYVTSGAMLALIGTLTADQLRRPIPSSRSVWWGWAVPSLGGVANATLIGLCLMSFTGLRWEGGIAFTVALIAALTPRRPPLPAYTIVSGSALARIVTAGSALLPSTVVRLVWRPGYGSKRKDASGSTRQAAPHTVLWVDDNPANNIRGHRELELRGMTVVLRETTADALVWLDANRPACIVSDMGRREGPREGYALLDAVRARGDRTPLFFYASSAAPEHRQETLDHDGQGCTNDLRELLSMIDSIRAM